MKSRPLPIDFAPNLPLGRREIFVLLVASLIAFAAVAWETVSLHALQHRQDSLRASVERLDKKIAAMPSSPTVALKPTDTKLASAAIKRLNTPWQNVFDALELTNAEDIALLSISPDTANSRSARQVRLTAEAKNYEAALRYLERLRGQPLFSSVVMTKHEVNDQDANHPLRVFIDVILTE